MLELKPQQLQELQNRDPSIYLLDVREAGEYQICHIEGSTLIPMSELTGAIDKLPRDKAIVVICHHGMRSYMVGSYLEQQGFENVVNLKGGIHAWACDIETDMPTY